jgi:APA family basic amino acid/polyamine antiporter
MLKKIHTVISQPPVKKGLGLWMLISLVVGNMIGSGIFLLPASLAPYGSISIVAWIITGIGSILLAFLFVDLNKAYPQSGGPYLYCQKGFGDCVGFLIAYNYWIAVWVANAAVAVALVGYLGSFWPALNEKAGTIFNPLLSFAMKVGILWLFTFINMLGVHRAGIAQLVVTLFKIIPLLLLSIAALFYVHPIYLEHFNSSGQSTFSALTATMTLTLWAFIGLESATIPAEEADKPQDVAKATLIGTGIAALVYILSTVAILGLIPGNELKNSQAPFADAAQLIFGAKASFLVAISAIISCAGALNGWILLQAQIPMAAARDGLFPAIFAHRNKSGTPIAGLIISSLLATFLLVFTLNQTLTRQFTFIILLATLAYVIPYFVSAMAQLILLAKDRELRKDKPLLKPLLTALFAGIYSFFAISGSGEDIVYYGMLLFFTGFPMYVYIKRKQQ